MIHLYFGIENLALNATQRGLLVDALQALEHAANNPQVACFNHWRTRLDGQAAIFEAVWNKDAISIETFKKRLGTIFGVSWVTIGHSVDLVTFDSRETAIVTFSRSEVDYLRVAFFGYDGSDWPTWAESGNECRAYLAANAEEWEPGE